MSLDLNEMAVRALTNALLADEESKSAILAQAIRGALDLNSREVRDTLELTCRRAVAEIARQETERLLAMPEKQAELKAMIEPLVQEGLKKIYDKTPRLVEYAFDKAMREY